jgi:uncharacterized protein (TIGR02246 family)
MSFDNPVEDEIAIRDLVARYADAVNRSDGNDWGATWAEDGLWSLMGMESQGRENIVQFWLGAMAGFKFAIHMNGSGALNIAGDSATGRWYLTEYTCDLEGNAATILGVYDDQYIKTDGSWLFKERLYQVMYMGPADLSGDYQPYQS